MIDEPIFVNFPKPCIPKGNMAGHIRELANTNNAMNITEVNPVVIYATIENNMPSTAQILNANCCDIILGMVNTPVKYPISIPVSVNEVRYLVRLGSRFNSLP